MESLSDSAGRLSHRRLAAARIAICVATILAASKLGVGLMSGSMAVIASAVDSTLDILMSGVNFLAIRQAQRPADKQHPFGHGKFESLATLFQVLVIACSGALLVTESIHRLIDGVELRSLDQGMTVLILSVFGSWAVSRHLRRVGKETDSPALQADALHFSMDIYTNLALLCGLVLVRAFEMPWLDPLMSIVVALYVLQQAWKLGRHGMKDILDVELPAETREKIEALLRSHEGQLLDYHRLRTRRAGSLKIMDFHLTVCRNMTVEKAHDFADHLEQRIRDEIPGADVTIHIEPCERGHCPGTSDCSDPKTRIAE